MSLSHRWLAPPAVPVSALRAWNRLRGTSVEAKNLVFTKTPAPEGRHYLCRGRQAPGRKKDKSSILSHRWLSPPAVPVSALRAWNKMRATSVAATHLMFTRNTSPGGAALPLAGADRPRGGRRIRVPSYPTGGCRHRQFLCRPSGPGSSCEEPLWKQQTECLPKAPAPEGRHYSMPGPRGPREEEEQEFHPFPPVSVSALRA